MGIATQNVTNSQGVTNATILAFTTDAVAAADTVFNFGFKPRMVRFVNLTDRLQSEVWEGIPATNTLDTIATGVTALGTSSSIVVNADGTVTVKAALMVASKSFVVIAEG
jgi:hypothetical protein